MDGTLDFFQNNPFLSGLLVGLLVALGLWARGVWMAMAKQRELNRLKEVLHTKLELEARSQFALKDELDGLRKQNENLRVTVQSLQQKPGRAELRQLHVYDAAIRLLQSRSPGFGPAWQSALDEAEARVAESETGLGAFVRRVFSPRSAPSLPESRDNNDDGTPSDQ